jgi:ElaB/YqjD/DUF883 family membrane-anchored ribosome-binding protein
MSAETLEREAFVGGMKNDIGRAESLLKELENEAGEVAAAAREKLATALASAKLACRKVEDKVAAGAKVADQTIREHPYQSIGVAFGLGVLVGYLVTRK